MKRLTTAAQKTGLAAYRRAMRTRGFSDGLNGRPKTSSDADYQSSWRRGVARRAELAA